MTVTLLLLLLMMMAVTMLLLVISVMPVSVTVSLHLLHLHKRTAAAARRCNFLAIVVFHIALLLLHQLWRRSKGATTTQTLAHAEPPQVTARDQVSQ